MFILLFIVSILNTLSSQNPIKELEKKDIRFYYFLFTESQGNPVIYKDTKYEPETLVKNYYRLLKKDRELLNLQEHALFNILVIQSNEISKVYKNKAIKFNINLFLLGEKANKKDFKQNEIYYIDAARIISGWASHAFEDLSEENINKINMLKDDIKLFLKTQLLNKKLNIESKLNILISIIADKYFLSIDDKKIAIEYLNSIKNLNHKMTTNVLYEIFLEILTDKDLYYYLNDKTLKSIPKSLLTELLFDILRTENISDTIVKDILQLKKRLKIGFNATHEITLAALFFKKRNVLKEPYLEKIYKQTRFSGEYKNSIYETLSHITEYSDEFTYSLLEYFTHVSYTVDNINFTKKQYRFLLGRLSLFISELTILKDKKSFETKKRKIQALAIFLISFKEKDSSAYQRIKEIEKLVFLDILEKTITMPENDLNKALNRFIIKIFFKIFDKNLNSKDIHFINKIFEKLTNTNFKGLYFNKPNACFKSFSSFILHIF